MQTELLQHLIHHFLAGARRRCAACKLKGSISYKAANLIDGSFGKTHGLQSVVDGIGQIIKGVEQRAVQIKNHRIVTFHLAFPPDGYYTAHLRY